MQILEGKKYFDAPNIHMIKDILSYGLQDYAERTAIVYRHNPNAVPTRVSYRELYQDAVALKNGLLSLGLAGENLALVGANSYAWMLTYLTATWDLARICPLDAMLTGVELRQLILRSHCAAVVLDMNALKSLLQLDFSEAQVRHLIVTDATSEEDFQILEQFKNASFGQNANVHSLAEVMAEGERLIKAGEVLADCPLEPDDPAVVLFTSGTTAISKAVLLSNKNICADIRALLETVKFKDPLRSLSLLPLHHTFENTCGFLSVLSLGGCIHICDGLRYISKNIQEYKIHMVIGVPKIFEAIHKRILQTIKRSGKMRKFKFGLFLSKILLFLGIDKRRKIFSDILAGLGGDFYIAISGAAALDKKIVCFFNQIGIEILQGYGLTETSPVIVGCNTQYNVMGSCGQPLSGVTIAVDSEEWGEPGDILAKGDMVMLGYLDNPEANEEVFMEDGWFKTGDIGYIDHKRQVLYLTGRSKSMIVLPSGKKVFPEEVEALLNENEYIKDSLVFGQEEANGDIVLTAKVVLDQEKMYEEGKASEEAIKASLDEYIKEVNHLMPSFKGIRSYVYSFQDMIKTTTLKVKRNVEIERLQELFKMRQLGWQDLIGVNLDSLETELEAEKPVLALSQEEQKHSLTQTAPPRKLDKLSTAELFEEKASCISTYDRQIKALERDMDREFTLLVMKKSQKEDVLKLSEDAERQALQSEYHKNLVALHEKYNRKIESSRAEIQDLAQVKNEKYQSQANELTKAMYLDTQEINRLLPQKAERSPEERAQAKAFEKSLKFALKCNKKEDRAERKVFKEQLRAKEKPRKADLQKRKKEQAENFKKQRQQYKTALREEKNKSKELRDGLQKTLELHANHTKALQDEQRQILKDLQKKNNKY